MTLHKIRQLTASLFARSRIDWLVASFPKSGNTWVRFILANYILQVAGVREPCQEFKKLNAFLPEFSHGNFQQHWQGQTIGPVLVKTHWKYWVGFKGIPTLLVVRNPGDVMVSFFHYQSKRGLWDRGFSEMIRSPRVGAKAWVDHYQSWADRCKVLIRYEDLKKDSFETMAQALQAMDFELDEAALQRSLDYSATENIRRVEQSLSSQERKSADGFVFVRDGSTEQWRSMIPEDDLKYINSLVPEDYVLS